MREVEPFKFLLFKLTRLAYLNGYFSDGNPVDFSGAYTMWLYFFDTPHPFPVSTNPSRRLSPTFRESHCRPI